MTLLSYREVKPHGRARLLMRLYTLRLWKLVPYLESEEDRGQCGTSRKCKNSRHAFFSKRCMRAACRLFDRCRGAVILEMDIPIL